ncbi:scaffold protein Nfu/NifU N terminal-domain-containing protein [Colletotrichum godetiae]|uniref:Scaffold protein Nfu/NifU N terminal-domain-containing protein n=1 Tax=Colletotrichum godetiae TaxID=1209918 RepID=A0AAJ0EYG0_9PEZI|nr:scaffold protein Nfu/NifU N terminal-domain-containing protein [Colletotrichum godetiae]KAK1688601.1 scaffold protein Nfu/NifU N terminal-domain-containing protein [Colletotrichum godetiae]
MSSYRATRTALRAVARTSRPATRPSQSRSFASVHAPSSAGFLHQNHQTSQRRPTATTSRQQQQQRQSPFAARTGAVRTIFIQTENTPNPDAVKFLPNHRILPDTLSTPFIEYLNPRSTIAPPYPSPLAAQLMNIDGVTSVFYGVDFITVNKSPDANWAHIRPEIFALITEAITSGQTIVTVSADKEGGAGAAADGGAPEEPDSLAYDENDSEVVGMIKELLETRIRPAIQEDGGDIEFRGFTDEGTVLLKLRGACRTCDSSTVTLKNGIESMLMHYIEEVKSVEQILDQEEEIANLEFAKFEEKLKSQKGPEATAA